VHADGTGADEDFIMIKVDIGIDRCCFLLSIIIRVCLKYKSPVTLVESYSYLVVTL